MSGVARFGAVVAVAGAIGLGMTAGGTAPAAQASTTNFGQQVSACASMMLPSYLGTDGSITMTMPGATTPMYFRTFGAMVVYMQQQMCS